MDTSPIPEHLPGEPPPPPRGLLAVGGTLLRSLALVLLATAVTLPFWPPYLLLRLAMPRPPHVPSSRRFAGLLRAVLADRPPPPGLSAASRAALGLAVLRNLATVPWRGLAWYLDDLLYGRKLRDTAIVAPLFEISAARSGSTQLARYLEADPHICAPSVLQAFFPYLWLWRLAPRTLGRLFPPERVRRLFAASLPAAYVQRHELDPYATDTFEVVFLALQLAVVAMNVGPRIARTDLSTGRVLPEGRELWEGDFLRYFDAVARKTVLHRGEGRRLMIKGHFLMVASALERRYPDARFLTVLRDPEKRIQSVVNFLRCHPTEPPCPPTPWPWLVELALAVEPEYCDVEMEWFQRSGGARRVVVRFDDYVRDLEGTMGRVYRECLDTVGLPRHVPTTHAPRVRAHYSIDRSLPDLGVDVAALRERLDGYTRWCDGTETHLRAAARR
jgi:hypothetical protein